MSSKLYMDGTKLNRHLEEIVKWKNDEWFAPIHIELSLSNICNQHCTFCYIDWSHGKARLDKNTTIKLIEDAAKIGVKSMLIAGEGEPTLNKAYVDACETAKRVGLDIALNTNAVNMSDEEIERVIPCLSWMRISFQAPERKLYSEIHQCKEIMFDKAITNIKKCIQVKKKTNSKVAIGLQQVLLNENGPHIYETAKLARDLGFDYYVIKPCHPHENNKAGYTTLNNLVEKNREILKKAETLNSHNFKSIIRWNFLHEAAIPRNYNKCLALPFILQIGARGDVFTCYPMAQKEEHLYGSLHEQSLIEILKDKNFKNVWQNCRDKVDVSKCMPTCRHHNANKYLWWLTEEQPDHLSFI